MNHARIEALLRTPLRNLQPGDVHRLRAGGFMDLVVEVLPPCRETGATVLSLCHYFEQNGDLCQDPEMVVRLFPPGSTAFRVLVPSTDPRHGRAEALIFQQAIPPVYREVYPELGIYRPHLSRELNAFLAQWLRNLKAQGHRPVDPRS
jgi:uncharacterized protein YqiB (DUF1249 family)